MGSTILKNLDVNGRLFDLFTPQVMGILNVTPDSFYAGGHSRTKTKTATCACRILDEGASVIDIGAYSSRSSVEYISPEEEMQRLCTGLETLNRNHPDVIISVGMFRIEAVRQCIKGYGAAIISDTSAGEMDEQMSPIIACLNVPYIIIHMQGTSQNMQKELHYKNLLKEVFMHFVRKVRQLHDLGMKDIILDPGFGLGKTLEHNYKPMVHLGEFGILELPLLVGVSCKSMIYRLFGATPQETLSGTVVLDMVALMKGVDILRVRSVHKVVEAIRLIEKLKSVSFHSRCPNI